MNSFKDFNIQVASKGFEGDKIKISKVLNKEIIVYNYKIEESKVFRDKGCGKCLQLQISINDIKHVIFTSGSKLIEAIQQIPENRFPFVTTIIEENDRFMFT